MSYESLLHKIKLNFDNLYSKFDMTNLNIDDFNIIIKELISIFSKDEYKFKSKSIKIDQILNFINYKYSFKFEETINLPSAFKKYGLINLKKIIHISFKTKYDTEYEPSDKLNQLVIVNKYEYLIEKECHQERTKTISEIRHKKFNHELMNKHQKINDTKWISYTKYINIDMDLNYEIEYYLNNSSDEKNMEKHAFNIYRQIMA